MKKEGRALVGSPFLLHPVSLGADVSTKVPGISLALYIWARLSSCWKLAPTKASLTTSFQPAWKVRLSFMVRSTKWSFFTVGPATC